MAQQLHKRFNDVQIKELIERYLKNEIARSYIQEILGIKRRRFWMLVKHYRANPDVFSVRNQRKTKPRKDVHDREVITRYIGELIQHDTSHHLWSPPAGEKWY